MQNSTKRIDLPYWRLKTFNEKLNASIAFIKEYWKPLLKANLLVGGPLFIVGIGLIVYNILVFGNNVISNPEDPGVLRIVVFFLNLFLGLMFYGVSILAITMVTLEFMKVQHNHPEKMDELNFIFQGAKKRLPKMIGFTLFGLFVSYLVGMVSQFLIIPLALIGAAGIIIFVPLYALAHISLYAYVYVIGPTAYYEKVSFSKTIEKGMRYIKGNFWQTVGMYFGSRIIQYIIVSGLLIPLISLIYGYFIYKESLGGGIGLFGEQGQRYALYLAAGLLFIFFFLNLFTNIFHVISGAVQYHTLKEDKENNYINSQIEAFDEI